jgi:hypothetical protein
MKEELAFTVSTDKEHYETIYDKDTAFVSFVSLSEDEKDVEHTQEIEYRGKKYHTFSDNHTFLEKGIVTLPSGIEEYISEEMLLEKVREFIHLYVDISPGFEIVSSYYVLLSWIYDLFEEIPYLRVIGDYSSGKSRFLQTVGALTYKTMKTSGATNPAPLFRIIERVKGTLVLDEANFKSSEMSDLIITILNNGYERSGYIMRCSEKDMNDIQTFDVFCPKILASRESFGDTALESRCIIEKMGKVKIREDIPRNLDKEFHQRAEKIRNMLLLWSLRKRKHGVSRKNIRIDGVPERINQIASTLLSVITSDTFSEEIMSFMKKNARDLLSERYAGREIDVVRAIFHALNRNPQTKYIGVKQIAEILTKENPTELPVTPRAAGGIVSKKLHIATRAVSGNGLNGNYAIVVSENEESLKNLKLRYIEKDSPLYAWREDNGHMDNMKEQGVCTEKQENLN